MNLLASTRTSILAIVSPFLFLAPCTPQNPEKHVNAQEAKALLDKDTTLVVLDVRTQAEFDSPTGHLPRAMLIPVQELEKRVKELEPYRSREILVYCRSGNRSMRASDLLTKNGFKIIHLDGGILQWNNAFPPTALKKEEGKKG